MYILGKINHVPFLQMVVSRENTCVQHVVCNEIGSFFLLFGYLRYEKSCVVCVTIRTDWTDVRLTTDERDGTS